MSTHMLLHILFYSIFYPYNYALILILCCRLCTFTFPQCQIKSSQSNTFNVNCNTKNGILRASLYYLIIGHFSPISDPTSKYDLDKIYRSFGFGLIDVLYVFLLI